MIGEHQVDTRRAPIRTLLTRASPAFHALFGCALAKDANYRLASAIEVGDEFRVALGLRDTPEWRAQCYIASVASAATTPELARAHDKRMATLSDFVVRGYRTAKRASM
jgi:hypothetical protein